MRSAPLRNELTDAAASSWTLPFQLCLGPLVGAIAAGCTAVVKPSEQAPHASVVLRDIIAKAFDPSYCTVVQGTAIEGLALLEQKWDKIFFTGSSRVGSIVAQKAAKTLTPVTLELGGRNPAIVSKNADIPRVAERLLWSKTVNAGSALPRAQLRPGRRSRLARAGPRHEEGLGKSSTPRVLRMYVVALAST